MVGPVSGGAGLNQGVGRAGWGGEKEVACTQVPVRYTQGASVIDRVGAGRGGGRH